MVYFQTKNTNLGNFQRGLQWKRLVYFKAIWSILWTFGLHNLVYLLDIWYISPRFGNQHAEKSGNPELWSGLTFITFREIGKKCGPLI
jgi:hypothetical protein